MAADGTKTMTAKLNVKTDQEMKPDAKKLVEKNIKTKKLYAKPITYEEKIDLNPKKWNEKKLSKAMAGLVRAELQLLAQRVGDLAKQAQKSKGGMSDEIKMVGALEKVHKKAVASIEEKCSDALEELASGKGEAKAGIALGKKAMAKISSLNANGVFRDPLETATKTLVSWLGPKEKGDEAKAAVALSKAQKDIDSAVNDLNQTGKDAQNVAKFLSATGKKLKDHENGQLANFGKSIMKADVQPELDKLDTAVDKLDKELSSYASDLKKGTLEVADAKKYLSTFNQMKGLQKIADNAVKAMKALEKNFKSIEKDLK